MVKLRRSGVDMSASARIHLHLVLPVATDLSIDNRDENGMIVNKEGKQRT